jgi:hypothetical protein
MGRRTTLGKRTSHLEARNCSGRTQVTRRIGAWRRPHAFACSQRSRPRIGLRGGSMKPSGRMRRAASGPVRADDAR